MKLRFAAALIALPLLAGCAGVAAGESGAQGAPASTPQPIQTEQPAETVATDQTPLPELIEPPAAQIVIDLANQTMTIPGTQYGTTNIPILAAGDVQAGLSVITAEPADALAYEHCEDRTAAWATEPNAQDAGAWARPLQLVTFDPACTDVASIQGHAIVVPRVVSEHQGEYGWVDQWLTEGREIIVVGESPYPDPNKGPITGGKLEWPEDRPVFLGSAGYKG